MTQIGQIFSPTGQCRPFDHQANGSVPSDGVCALVLKRLSDAVADGDMIYAVINAVGIGSEGNAEKAGLTVPSPRGQAEVVKEAWKKSGLSPKVLQYVECVASWSR